MQDIHDVHIRTVTSGLIAMSGHHEIVGARDWHEILVDVNALLTLLGNRAQQQHHHAH